MRIKDFFSLSRYKAVAIYFAKKFLHSQGETNQYLELHIIEQLHYRMLMCSPCANANKCEHCGCHFEGRANGFFDSCSDGKWGMIFMDKDDWFNYKKMHNLKFNLEKDGKQIILQQYGI